MTKISVLMPSYNYGRFIGEAISSFLSQQAPDAELIVQDACSDDETEAVVKTHSDPSVHFLQEADAGQSDGLNRAMARATGDWVGWLNADEFYLPGALNKAREVIANDSSAGVVYGDCLLVDEAGRPLRLLPAHHFSRFVLENYGCFISSCATFTRLEVLRSVGFDLRFRRAMDWDLWLSISKDSKMTYVPYPFAAFRLHGAQVTASPMSLDPTEFDTIRAKHDIRVTGFKRSMGRADHGLLKLTSGAYTRQFEAWRNQR